MALQQVGLWGDIGGVMDGAASREVLKAGLLERARELGLDAVGIAPVEPELRREYYLRWIQDGRHGEMSWMERNNDRRLYPQNVLPEARSIICVGLNYYQPRPERRGVIATYALGGDYHKSFLKKLKQLCEWLREQGGENKPYVDTGPVMERPIAAQAGLGWQGKHTNLIHPKLGNWIFLGEIFTTLDLPPDEPVKSRCGSCTRCMDACPTGAITGPYQLDARRCISYLTIEHKGPIPVEVRELMGDHLYGCDDCLAACPWNRWAVQTQEARFQPRDYPDLTVMLEWDEARFEEAFAGTPIKRAGLSRWKRNCCVVLGNTGTLEDVPALEDATRLEDTVVAEHAEWAIARIRARLTVAEALNHGA